MHCAEGGCTISLDREILMAIRSPNAVRPSTRTNAGLLLLFVLGTGSDALPDPLTEGSQVELAEPVRKFTIPEHDLFPESIAHDPVSGDYFLGSMSRSRILRIHPDGSYEDFLTSPVPELASSIGIKADADRRVLWVCTGRFSLFANPDPGPPRTGLLQLDLDSGALLASWLVSQESPYHICNDMQLAADGSAFVTTTLIGRTYRVAPDLGEVVMLHQLEPGSHNNGITFGPEEEHLFVAADRGIRRYDLSSADVLEIEIPPEAGVGPDGLYYHQGSLIMVQPRSNQVVRLVLNDSRTAVERFDVLARGHRDFAYPTTGVLVGDTLVLVASSYADRSRRDGALAQHGDIFIYQLPLTVGGGP